MRCLYASARLVLGGKGYGPPSERVGKERCMRFMLTFRIPPEKGNEMIKDGTLPRTIQTILEDLKPEAA